jgi:hypothetical protein
VTFSGAGLTDQKDWFSPCEIAAFGQGADARGWDVWRLREIEILKRLHAWQMRILEAQFDGAALAVLHFRQQQGLQILQVRAILLAGFLGQRCELSAVPS